jgi:hypothetical protein
MEGKYGMTKAGFKGVNIYEEVYEEALKFIWETNQKHGFKKIRSMAHLVELALEHYIEEMRREDKKPKSTV